jgi:hypothetical protein
MKVFSKQTVDDYVEQFFEQAGEIIAEVVEEPLPVFRTEFPVFFDWNDHFDQYHIDLMILGPMHDNGGVTFNAIDIPGCCAYGENRRISMVQFLQAYVECASFRFFNKMKKTDQVSNPIKTYGIESGDIKYDKLVKDLHSMDWKVAEIAHYNTIITNIKSKKVAITIPNIDIIPSALHSLIYRFVYSSDLKSERFDHF